MAFKFNLKSVPNILAVLGATTTASFSVADIAAAGLVGCELYKGVQKAKKERPDDEDDLMCV